MRLMTAIGGLGLAGVMASGLNDALASGEIVVFSRRAWVASVGLAEDPGRFALSAAAHAFLLALGLWIGVKALLNRDGERIRPRRGR